MSRAALRRDMDVFAEIYNEAWKRNWDFVPYTEDDLDAYAQEMQLVFDRTGSWSPSARTRRAGRRRDHASPTSTRCCAG